MNLLAALRGLYLTLAPLACAGFPYEWVACAPGCSQIPYQSTLPSAPRPLPLANGTEPQPTDLRQLEARRIWSHPDRKVNVAQTVPLSRTMFLPYLLSHGVQRAPLATPTPPPGTKISHLDAYANCVVTESFDEFNDGVVESRLVYTYGENGHIQRIETLVGSDSEPSKVSEYHYDSGGRLTGRVLDNNGDGLPNYSSTYVYDHLGRLVRYDIDKNADGIVDERDSIEYDSASRVKRRTFDYENDGTVDAVYDYQYDRFGRETSRHFDSNADGTAERTHFLSWQLALNTRRTELLGDDVVRIITLHYDVLGYVVREEYDEGGDGGVDSHREYRYNARGDLTMTQSYRGGHLEDFEVIEYDEYGRRALVQVPIATYRYANECPE